MKQNTILFVMIVLTRLPVLVGLGIFRSTEWSKKLHKIQCTVILQPFAVASRGFHQNAQRLTGNGQIVNIVIKYSLSDSW